MKKIILLAVFLSWSCTAQAKGKIQDGLYKIYHKNTMGGLAMSKKVKLNGVAFEYYKNGDIKRQSWYQKNKLQGATEIYSKEKKLVEVDVYNQNTLMDVKKYDDNGKVVQ